MLNSYTKLFVNLLIAISYFSQVKSDEIQGIKKPIIEKNPKKDTIFNYIENEVLKHPIHDLSHYKTDDIESLLINYKNPKENNVKYNKESFDLGNSSNIYYYYKYPTKEPGLNENLIDFDDTKDNENNNNRFDSCLGSVAFCSYQRATFLLNKIDSNEEDKRQALELLHKSEKEVPESLFLLGVIYENYDIFFLFNKNITNNKFENDLKSVSYFEKCSSLGDINCQLAVAHKHYLGELLPRDLSKSATLYYSVLNKVIKKYDSNNRYPWILSNHDRNIWNHNFFKFVNDHKLSDFEYVDLNDDSDALVKDSSILLNTKSSLPLSEGSGDLELIKVMHFLHEARNMLKKNSDPEFVKDLMRVNLHNPVFENLKYLYFREDFLFIEDEILLYVYTDIKNSMNGNIFSNDKDMNYVFELLKIIIKIYKDKQTLLDSKLSLLGKYYLRELIIIFTNVYKQYGDFESENEKNINLIFSLYKTANGLSSKVRDETFWEVFKFLHYLNPEADFEKIFYDYIKDKQTTGYATFAVLNYDNGAKIQKIFKENLQADHYIINDFGLQKNIQLGISSKYIPALYQSCKFDFQLLPASQAQEKAIFIQKLRVILESLQMKENIPIFHQNFVNIMNYKTGKSY
ncbi:hypothetical protein HANVADRAFT_215 [Hanseniaspora valbyensis NRRL Y-1626]|uniref:HCP-like protein n=1 Tax=Hanseniaspora valbyensis NRRL Y-1626 TaxID=766949 RepID=A0A1B7TK89_9ASCO|nr:hypothetical protein HANVADRAFT_215 [Hanseniaspora valbyensis NRRL Y-1626]